ncbi:response regulator [Tychonema sp. BBK16]|uniref:response regulator n=1 Tax=Tychonema sp. BBK16 TaxID=2699888 RepID=UPI001F1BA56E|nr:response regulator [Tychonema sp. BBK16]MCF6373691.1 response regulator [Tychonema sp. BBK16]
MTHHQYHSVKGNILIVDDISANLQLLAQILSEQGYKTRTAPNGQLALRSIDLTPPDLILLDIMMPTMDGYQVCQALKASPKTKDIPVIFISALNEVFDKVKAFEVGGVDYITKPFHEQEVIARVSNQLVQRRLFLEIQQQNKNLESEIIDRRIAQKETQFLLSTTFSLAKSNNFKESTFIMLRCFCEFINWDFAEIWIPSSDNIFLMCSQSFYTTNEPCLLDYRNQSLQITFAPNVGLPGRIWSSKQPEWLEDISLESDQVFTRNKIAAKAGLKACVGVPILADDRVLAILMFFNKKPLPSQPRLMELINALATQLASILQRQLAEERLKQQFQKEQLLNQLTQSIRCSLKLNTIFSTAAREIAISLGVDRVAVARYLPEKQLWINISEYYDSTQLETTLGLEVSDENNEISDRLKQSKIVKIDDTNTCSDEIKQRLTRLSPGAWLFVPLKVDSQVWGSICVVKENRSYYWQVFEIELLCAVADSIAIAIKQAQIYQEIQSYAQQLESTLTELKKTQAQLVQKAKMASLGQLVAGVAHEINNPVNFIYGNTTVAMDYARDLLDLIELYRKNYPQPATDIYQKLESIDVNFIADDYPKLLNSMKDGASRISKIVLSLRNFSRLDEKEYKLVDIHEGIDNTLLILQHRLNSSNNGHEIEVIKDYGQLPKLQCYASQLNQVFMNLIANAVDALETQSSPRRITISTKMDISASSSPISDAIVILIADNGCGMSEKVRDQIFDPFFTTKPVGSGIGLGLAICHNIVVEKHRGQISCVSDLDEGTEFMVQIPI